MKMRFKNGKMKALTLSYDDGVIQDKRLTEILASGGIKCTFNISSGRYLPEGTKRLKEYRMSLSECKEAYKEGIHEIAVHSFTHPNLTDLDDSGIVYEITEDRRAIERDYNCIAKGMAYPFSAYNSRVEEVLAKCGIVYARTTKSTEYFELPEKWLEWHPTCHHNNPRLMELAKLFCEEKNRHGRAELFYLWGHSYEFDINNNWKVIEEFAEYAGGREDIWYATNGEIYDYVEAYRRLTVGYDKKIIHNPSAIDVWAYVNEKLICIKSGETVVL